MDLNNTYTFVDEDINQNDEENQFHPQNTIYRSISQTTYLPIPQSIVNLPILPHTINLNNIQMTSVVVTQHLLPVTSTQQQLIPHEELLRYVYQDPTMTVQFCEEQQSDNNPVFVSTSEAPHCSLTPHSSKAEEENNSEPLDLRINPFLEGTTGECSNTPMRSVDTSSRHQESGYIQFMKSIYNEQPSMPQPSQTSSTDHQSGSCSLWSCGASSSSSQQQQPSQTPRKRIKMTLKQLQEIEKSERDEMYQHQERKFSDEKAEGNKHAPYKCSQCSSSFNKRSSWRRHEFQHTGLRPHQCSYCQSKFKLKHHLEEHVRRHTNEKPYQCFRCLKKFTHSGSYSQHMKKRYPRCASLSESSTSGKSDA